MKRALLLFLIACGGPPAKGPEAPPDPATLRAQSAELARTEARVFEHLAVADPRLAKRTGVTPSEAVIKKLGTSAMLAEDTGTYLMGTSLDVFSFKGRARSFDNAAAELAAHKAPIPERAPPGSPIERPRLERELLERLIGEEKARLSREESSEAPSDLVRGLLDTWIAPVSKEDASAREEWLAKRIRELKDEVSALRPPNDLDAALDPLERMLAPFPRAMAALTELRLTISSDDRPNQPTTRPELLRGLLHDHLGVAPEMRELRLILERTEEKLRAMVDGALAKGLAKPDDVEHNAEQHLFKEGKCGSANLASPIRTMRPPPERELICGMLRTLVTSLNKPQHWPALMALHDELVVAIWSLPPLMQSSRHTRLMVDLPEEQIDRLRRMAAARPALPLGVGLAVDMLLRGDLLQRASAWLAFGDAPLDIVEREVFKK